MDGVIAIMKRVPCLSSLRKILFTTAVACGAVSPAAASCSTANQYNFSFATQTPATLNYATTYTYTATSTALGSQNFMVGFTTNGTTSTVVGGFQMPNISNMVTDGVAANNLAIGATFGGRTVDVSAAARVIVTTFTFPVPIRDFTIQVNDVDFAANQYRDWLQVNGIIGATSYDPALITPFGNNNTVIGPHSATNSTQLIGVTATPLSLTVRQSAGTATSGNNANNGTITASFAQPVTSVQVRYGNYPFTTGENTTGQQAFGIQSISYCPMPSVSILKSTTPFSSTASDPNRFNIPGADVIYTLAVTNTNSSPVDAGTIVLTDALPANMTFYNGDIDDAGALTTNYEFTPGTSGLSFSAANLTYSNNSGSTYAYTPAAGYDTAVNAIRLNPQNAMAANSTFSLKFRMRIK
jgi:uncharacterized repeat protein (TIGR01451 family)